MIKESLYDIWSKRNPKWELRFEDSLLRLFTDYGVGASESMSAKGKIFGAGYELYIFAFFVGLYEGKKRPLSGETKTFGQPIQFWGNLDNKKFRKAYPKIRDYIFAALIARTEDINEYLLKLEAGEISPSDAIDMLKDTMEQYANYGFYFIEDKLKENPNYFYSPYGFLNTILSIVTGSNSISEEIEDI